MLVTRPADFLGQTFFDVRELLTLFNLEGTLIDSNGLWTEHLSSDSHFCTLKTEQRKTKKSKATEDAMLERAWQQQKCGTFRVTQQQAKIFCEMPA